MSQTNYVRYGFNIIVIYNFSLELEEHCENFFWQLVALLGGHLRFGSDCV